VWEAGKGVGCEGDGARSCSTSSAWFAVGRKKETVPIVVQVRFSH